MAATGNQTAAALLFMSSSYLALDAYSTLNSSPWTSENFGADPEKAASCREYVKHAVIYSMVFAGISAWIGRSQWPLWGAAATNVYLYWLYERALGRGAAAGTASWANGEG